MSTTITNIGGIPVIDQSAPAESATGERYIPINKGHFDLEPPERLAAFSEKLARGWESEYADYRQSWNEYPSKSQVADYPLLVDLEMASRCNLTCPMCPTVTDEFIQKRVAPYKRGLLDFALAKKIIDEIAGKVPALRLSWVGEPTLHPKLIEVVRYAKQKGIREVSFLTNGTKLKLSYFIQLVDAGLDWVTVSVDGMGDTYNDIRKPLKFDETLAKLHAMAEYKVSNGLEKPVIKIQGIWPAIRENPQGFYNTFAPIVDLIAFNPLIDYLHKDTDIIYQENFSCPQYYQRVVISSNGQAAMCSNDDLVEMVVGDANVETIHQIWHGEKLNALRQLHLEPDGFKKIGACAHCYYPRKTFVDETTNINGREVAIENYINRAQTVGE